jgi:hypothetical protein
MRSKPWTKKPRIATPHPEGYRPTIELLEERCRLVPFESDLMSSEQLGYRIGLLVIEPDRSRK